MGILLSQELAMVIVALIAVAGGYITLLINEKNKRTFHFIEETWKIKYSLFEDLISKFYQMDDCCI